MYYVNKIVGWILSPLGMFFLALALAYALSVVARRKGERGRRWAVAAKCVLGVSVAFLWIMSCGITTRFIGAGLETDWERPGMPHGSIEGLPDADAIVVLGGGMGMHEECGAPEMLSSADRVWTGARLYKSGKAKIVTLSGPDVERGTVPLMLDFGVPREAMLYFSDARNTEEESRMIFERLAGTVKDRPPRILLVTSAWHMSRSKLLFEKSGFEVVPAPTDFEMSYAREQPVEIGAFFPSSDALRINSYAVKEWIANFGYRFLRR